MCKANYTVIGPKLLAVCGWCFPGNKIFEVQPELRGNEISHSICEMHREKISAQRLRRVQVNQKPQ